MKQRRDQSGVALVITLIMLTVITLIAVAFLALSQRERSSVSSTISATEDELMLNAGLERARGQILADMAAFMANPTNRFTNAANQWVPRLNLGPDLLVSITDTNYLNWPYLTPGRNPNDRSAIADLLEDPRVPVFVARPDRDGFTNRFYLDLNRNDRFEPSGVVPLFEDPTQFHYAIGDPEWVGVLSRINEVHSGTNRFIGRYAYIIIPIGRTADIDAIHNDAKGPGILQYFRNQGHGSWELNLAGFLADLNTNRAAQFGWGDYRYNTNIGNVSGGVAFDDASAILNYRYATMPLRSAQDVFGFTGDLFAGDGIDQYANGSDTMPVIWATQPWAGAPNPQHFFTIHDFFNLKDPARYGTFQNFQGRLRNAGLKPNEDSYNRYTFYRMLAQLGSDTAPERPRYRAVVNPANGNVLRDEGPINLNYVNSTNGLDATDFVPWDATNFFHTVADRLLRDHGIGLSTKNIEIYPRNDYTPSVHRILQLAINIYDATTTNRGPLGGPQEYPYYPTALKPIFDNGGGNQVRIVGYREVKQGDFSITNAANWYDLTNSAERASLPADAYVYGVPVLIGAKKGYPNFNEFAFQTEMQVERKLQLVRPQGGQINATNHMFYVGVSNYLGLEIWNSYTNPFPRPLRMFAGAEITRSLYNDEGFRKSEVLVTNLEFSIPAGTWAGEDFRYGLPVPPPNKSWVNDIFQPYAMYQRGVMITNLAPPRWEPTYPVRTPQWVLSATNRFRFSLFDNGYLVDAVGLGPTALSTNITRVLDANPTFGPLWRTNLVRGVPQGIANQILVSTPGGVPGNWDPTWSSYGRYDQPMTGQGGFVDFLTNTTRTAMQVPYTPYVKIFRKFEWRANDPLVHYIEPDLRRDSPTNNVGFAGLTINRSELLRFDIGKRNPECAPWGGPPNTDLNDPSKQQLYANLYITDPLVAGSDAWDFPTNKLASIGLLGRVHRGTPWQTISFKPAPDPKQDNWMRVHYSMRAHPTNDWRLADIFTVAQHPNASRGRMSVNQTNLAGWSAVFSGIQIPMLDGSGVLTTNVIEPASIDPRLDQLVTAINGRRQQLPGGVFSSLAEFVSIPELTIGSPFLTSGGATFAPAGSPLRDADYESLLEKSLSLVKPGEARFMVYVFGQSLKPAPQSVIGGGALRGLCVNYEVAGEMAAKAVIRVDLVPVPPPNPVPAEGYLPVRPQAVIESFNLLPPD